MISRLQMLIVICAINQVLSDEHSIDWCALKCRQRRSTMCEFEPHLVNDDCAEFKQAMTSAKRKNLLHLHNDFRNKIAEGRQNKSWPKAADMRQIGWDPVLEAVAMRWASQCVDDNDPCPLTPDFWYIGQNVATFSNTGVPGDMNGTEAFRAWSKEIKNVELKPSVVVDKFDGSFNYGHFTQIIWAESYRMGCAQITFQKSGWYNTYFYCYYGLGGNFMGDPVYTIGPPCSKCPEGTNCKPQSQYPSLCALPSDSTKPEEIGSPPEDLIDGGNNPLNHGSAKLIENVSLSFIVFLKMLF